MAFRTIEGTLTSFKTTEVVPVKNIKNIVDIQIQIIFINKFSFYNILKNLNKGLFFQKKQLDNFSHSKFWNSLIILISTSIYRFSANQFSKFWLISPQL